MFNITIITVISLLTYYYYIILCNSAEFKTIGGGGVQTNRTQNVQKHIIIIATFTTCVHKHNIILIVQVLRPP